MEEQVGRSLVKQLACCKKNTRDKALGVLIKSWLPSQTQPLPEEDSKKLWKGLFYCIWHSDKPLVQSELVHRLSSLLLSLQLPLSIQYFSTFLLTIRREWSGIDALRLDKFYLLIRSFLSNFFSLMKSNSWDPHLVRRLLHLFDQATFSAHDNHSHGNGVNYHIASVFIDELSPFLPLNHQLLLLLFNPFFSAMARVHDKILLAKIKSGVFDVLLKMGRRLLEVKNTPDELHYPHTDLLLGTVALVMGFSGTFYEIASSAECWQGNRKMLFALHSQFLKLEKDAANSGFHFALPNVVDGEDVPELVPLEPAANDGKEVSIDGGKSKKKKKKKGDTSVLANAAVNHNGNVAVENGKDNVATENGGNLDDENAVVLTEAVIANLQKQFEKVAQEAGLDDEVVSASDAPGVVSATGGTLSKKRKRTKSLKQKASKGSADLDGGDGEESAVAKSEEKSTKKVRFSMKNNLVWKPHNPLPPQSLRLPPSATPRGSALKKGVPPGPIREMLPPTKKPKLKKARKAIKGVSPSVKRLKKLKSRAA